MFGISAVQACALHRDAGDRFAPQMRLVRLRQDTHRDFATLLEVKKKVIYDKHGTPLNPDQ
jgi:hypothetical protein